jgi:tetratricopeptide (TPR) repeat protein
LISKSRGAQGLRFSLHRQVKRHVITRSPTDALERGVSWVVQRLRQLFPRQSAFTGELDDTNHNCGEYINHVLALRDSFPILRRLTLEAESLASLFLDSGIYLWARGLTEDGKALTGLAEELCGTGHFAGQMSAQIYAFHASVLSDSGDNHDALEYFERSLVVLKGFLRSAQNRVLPSDEALLANAWNNLAGIHCALGNFDEAEMYNDMSLQLKQKLHNAGQPVSHLLCLSYSNIANTYALQGYYEEASKFFEKALEVGVTSDSLSRRALTSHNYGHMRLAQNMVEDARQLFENAYRLRTKKIGDHPDTAASLHMLASCYHRSGDVDNLLIAR